MSIIDCSKEKAAARDYDLVVVGGGIHGAMLTLEASLRGISVLLLERDDFGAATSFNSLRIIHGGFRYIQHLDFQRLISSARERQWFLRFFPEISEPIACLMPLYGEGLKHPMILAGALRIYQLLTERFNRQLDPSKHIPRGRIISSEQVVQDAPWVIRDGLRGGAVWYDGFMPDSHRILIGVLRWACEHGAAALNYCKAEELVTHQGGVVAVRARDQGNNAIYEFRTKRVVNAAGPWCRHVATRLDRDVPDLFNTMVAWNVLFNRPAVSSYAIAVSPPHAGSRAYFIVPWKGMFLAGTGQVPWDANRREEMIKEDELDIFCRDLNLALPSLELKKDDIIHVYPGLQSAKKPGGVDFSHRDVIVDHSQANGPKGLFSISGIKFTTARLLAERVLNKIFPQRVHVFTGESTSFYRPPADIAETSMLFDYGWQPNKEDGVWRQSLKTLIDQEAVQHVDDLVVRRSNLGDNPQRALEAANLLCGLFDWDEEKCKMEIDRLKNYYSFPILVPGAVSGEIL